MSTDTAATAVPVEAARTPPTRRGPRAPLSWVSGGRIQHVRVPASDAHGLRRVSWLPIGRAVVMSFQETNFVTAAELVGLDNFRAVLSDPLLWTAVKNTAYFALLALVFGYPVPLIAAVLMSEVRRFKGLYSALAYLPVVVPPVVAVLLWKFFYDARPDGVFNTILGWVGLGPYPWLQDADLAMPALVLQATWAAAGGTVIIYLAALIGVADELYDAAEVDGAVDLAEGLARHDAAAARRAAHHVHPADHRHGPGVPRAVPVHRWRPGQRDVDDPAADLQLRVRQQPGRRLRCGDGAEPHARRVARRAVGDLLRAHPSWSTS